MNIKVEVKGSLDSIKSSLVVGNHLSYLDVLILAAHIPASFVTSIEIKKTPILGQICQLAGCLFVERRSRENLNREVGEIGSALRSGQNVVVFPEGTSTDGSCVLRFKKPLFQSALDAGVRVRCFTLNYRSLDSLKVDRSNRDIVFWYGDMSFFSHLWSFFKVRETRVELFLHSDQLESEDFSLLSMEAQQVVSSKFISVS